MGKVQFEASLTGEGGVMVDKKPVDYGPPRHNLFEIGSDGKRQYVTTVRAESFEAACRMCDPAKTYYPDCGEDIAKTIARSKDDGRYNLFVLKDGKPEYVCTERCDSEEEAIAAAQEKYPGVTLVSQSQL